MKKEQILKMREQGMTLKEIGDSFGVTRQRICQIIKNRKFVCDYVRIYILKKYNYKCQLREKCDGNNYISDLEVHHIDCDPNNGDIGNLTILCKKCHKEFHRIAKRNICEFCNTNDYKLKYSQSFDKKICIRCYKIELQKRRDKWSIKYDECKECGTTKIKHQSHGLCRNCYQKNRWRTNLKYRKEQTERIMKWQKENPERNREINLKSVNKWYQNNRKKLST